MVCLSGFRNSLKLDPHMNTSGVAYDVPLHAIDVLPWMAPEILQQVGTWLHSKPSGFNAAGRTHMTLATRG